MRRGFGQYSTDSGLDTSGVTVGGGAATPGMTSGQLDLLPFGGSVIAGETPIQGGVACFGPGCSSGTSGGGNAAAPTTTSTILIFALGIAAIIGVFIATGGKR
jgi:hypothetical protein